MPLTPDSHNKGLSIGAVAILLQEGHALSREGWYKKWNGPPNNRHFIVLPPAFDAEPKFAPPIQLISEHEGRFNFLTYTLDTPDILASDWYIWEPEFVAKHPRYWPRP